MKADFGSGWKAIIFGISHSFNKFNKDGSHKAITGPIVQYWLS